MKYRGFVFILTLILSLTWLGPLVGAQTASEIEVKRALLQAELEAEEREIAKQTALLQAKQKETATVTGEITLLKSQIAQAQANIKAKKVAISRLADGIIASQGKIVVLDNQVKKNQSSLAELLRKTNEVNSASFAEILLDSRNLSDFFQNVDDYEVLQEAIHQTVNELRDTKVLTEKEKQALEDKKNKELDAQKTIEYEQALIAKKEKERQQVLAVTKGEEKAYQQVLAERQKKAAQIRAALFALRDTAAIPFGKALEYATAASKKTGVRPAFVLAILTQESNLGANVGTCNRPGDPVSKQWQAIMPGPTDIAAGLSRRDDESAFLKITSELGISPEGTPLSCPWGSGWGGAMGPAQFIPTTWMLFKDRIASFLGKKTANPWEPQDAFMASSIYLSDLGASAQTYSAERNAACRYYSGRACDTKAPANSFYGDQVMAKATSIQLDMIDPLQNI